MDEYIEREAAIKEFLNNGSIFVYGKQQCKAIVSRINAIPAADVVPVRHGRWVDTEPNKRDWDYRKNGMAYYCSCCLHRAGKEKHKTYKYCPWCGAKMEKEMKPDGV